MEARSRLLRKAVSTSELAPLLGLRLATGVRGTRLCAVLQRGVAVAGARPLDRLGRRDDAVRASPGARGVAPPAGMGGTSAPVVSFATSCERREDIVPFAASTEASEMSESELERELAE